MNILIAKVRKAKNKINKILWTIVAYSLIIVVLSFFILPFLGKIKATHNAFAIIWYISCALILAIFIDNAIKQKNIKVLLNILYTSPIFLFFILVFIGNYYNYPQFSLLKAFNWSLISILALFVAIILFKTGNETSKQIFNKTIKGNQLGIIGILLVIAEIAFIISCIYSYTILIFILGTSLSLIFMFNSYGNMQKWIGRNVAPINKALTFIDFIIGVGIMVYLIYIIPNKDLQSIILTILGAITGGLLTLLGVAWTIKRQDENRREDNRLKVKPIFVLISTFPKEKEVLKELNDSNVNSYHFFSQNREIVDLNKPIEGQITHKTSDQIAIKNLDNGVMKIKSINCNGDFCNEIYDITVEKGEKFILVYEHKINIDYETAEILLEIEDVYENTYLYKFVYSGNLLKGFEEKKELKK